MNSIFWVGLILYVALPPFQSSPQANPLPPLQYTITMIKDLPWGGIVVTSLNDRGQGVGFAYRSAVDASCCEKGFVWDNGKAFLLRPLSGRYTIPLHINNRGDIVGVSETIRWKGIHFEDEEIRLFPVIWESVGSLRKTVSRFPVALSTEEGGAYGINDQGEIVGSGRASNERGSYPCYWKSRDIQKLSRASGSRGVAINERGDYITDGSSNGYPSPVGFLSLISQGKSLPLKGLGGKFAILHGLNNSGAVVGTCDDTSDYPRACLWKDKTPIELESLGGRGRDVAYGINDAGLIVGRSTLSSGKQVACLWQNRKATPLSSLLTNATGWKLEAAQAINNKNQIAGIGSYRGKSTAFLMTPTRASAQKSNRPLSQLPSYSILDGATHYGRYHWVSSTIIQIEMENGDQNLWSVAEHKFVHREAVRRINRRFRGDQLFFLPIACGYS